MDILLSVAEYSYATPPNPGMNARAKNGRPLNRALMATARKPPYCAPFTGRLPSAGRFIVRVAPGGEPCAAAYGLSPYYASTANTLNHSFIRPDPYSK